MKTTILVQDDATQIVLTPENDWEKSVLSFIGRDGPRRALVIRGSFFECRGGFTRAGDSDESVILRVGMEPSVPMQ